MEKIVRMSYVIAGVLVWIVLASFFGFMFEWLIPNLDKNIIGAQFTVSDLMGLLSGGVLAVWLWRNELVFKYGMEIVAELRNVTWPKWPETRTSTIVVIVTTVVVSLVLGFFDFVVGAITKAIYGL
ncbi:MAG TPA: preprotein translocase subunit SecE [Myxococcota bacterium]|nr:preprotein translocase subunit SecE [Myxococcota bacterium]